MRKLLLLAVAAVRRCEVALQREGRDAERRHRVSVAGKAAGEAPAASPADTRSLFFLGGDPGQASMVHSYLPGTTDTVPFRGRLSPDRPTGGVPNRYPRPVAGFNTFENPFLPHFRVTFAEPRSFAGDASALVWVSSPTLKDGGELFVELFADGGPVGSVKVPEAQVGENPTPLAVTFPDVVIDEATTLTFQLGTVPAVSSAGNGKTADALFTVHYGSVQYPSRVALP